MSQPQPNPPAYTPFYVSPLETAIKAQDRRQVRLLVRSGVSVNQRNSHGQTPLHVAASLKDTFIVDLLVKNGAHLETRTLFHETPLLVAQDVFGNIDMVYYLVRLGADIDVKNHAGEGLEERLTQEEWNLCVDISEDVKNGTMPVPNRMTSGH